MDSQTIAERLEELSPAPSLHLDTMVHESVHAALLSVIGAARPTIILAAQQNILSEGSAAWHAQDRERRFGKSVEQWEKDEGGEKGWKAAQPGLEAVKAELNRHKRDEGPFVLGGTVSYGDFLIAGFFEWLRRADASLYERYVRYDESFKKHREACEPWLARDD
ncbi:uncharacterized protein LTR77_008208 [Saxophila tyrrhenica]|uniref:Glutathione S-transferase UstS-like C-terminal domain-containing protein n=1 Tax=Saxophila tyrrhenica TaxID=1690608 RepID=A0AAV9P660_9PEZI|nr:hypothetical protein LTR77_008208 [Saxophila tyrrhenica]